MELITMYHSETQINNFLRILSGIFCPICQEDKNRSRRFSSTQALLWHLEHEHANEPKILGISVDEVKEIIRKLDKAIEIGIVRPSTFPQVGRIKDDYS